MQRSALLIFLRQKLLIGKIHHFIKKFNALLGVDSDISPENLNKNYKKHRVTINFLLVASLLLYVPLSALLINLESAATKITRGGIVVRHWNSARLVSRQLFTPLTKVGNLICAGALATTLSGCEANLNLAGVEETLEQPIRRTDQFLALEQTANGDLIAFADDGVVVHGRASPEGINWRRETLDADRAPTFIDSASCSDGAVVGLSFYNEVWWLREGAWTVTPIDTFEQLEAIECRAENEVWAAGSFSSFYRTQDSGVTWEDLSIGEDATITNMQFVDEDFGYAVGEFGMVFQTADGGEQWSVIDPVAEEFYPLSLFFADRQHGWVGGVLGIVFATEDGGLSWTQQETESHAAVYGFFQGNSGLYAFGDQGSLMKLEDGVWRRQATPPIPIHYKAGLELDSGEALLVGGWGLVMTIPLTHEAQDGAAAVGSN